MCFTSLGALSPEGAMQTAASHWLMTPQINNGSGKLAQSQPTETSSVNTNSHICILRSVHSSTWQWIWAHGVFFGHQLFSQPRQLSPHFSQLTSLFLDQSEYPSRSDTWIVHAHFSDQNLQVHHPSFLSLNLHQNYHAYHTTSSAPSALSVSLTIMALITCKKLVSAANYSFWPAAVESWF